MIPPRIARAVPLMAAAIVHLPTLGLPFIRDDHHSLYHAALTRLDAAHILEPWMGGALRLIPKLWFVGAFELFGTTPAPYRVVNLALHLFCTWQLMRLIDRMIGGDGAGVGHDRVALLGGLLFGLGFGGHLRPVFQISNTTMLAAAAFLLPSLGRALEQRWRSATALWIAALLCHEVVAPAPLIVPLLGAARRGLAPGQIGPAGRTTVPAAIALTSALAVVPLGRVHEIASRVAEQLGFLLFPINTPSRLLARVPSAPEITGVLVGAAELLIRHREWIGLAVAAGFFMLARSRRPLGPLAGAWTFLFLVPPAWLIVTSPEAGPLWQHGWLERRYLYLPGLAVAPLLAYGVEWVRARASRLSRTALVLLIVWILSMDAITWDNYRRLSCTGDERERRARLEAALDELGTTGEPK